MSCALLLRLELVLRTTLPCAPFSSFCYQGTTYEILQGNAPGTRVWGPLKASPELALQSLKNKTSSGSGW